MAKTTGRTQHLGTNLVKERSGTLPSGVKYNSTRGRFGNLVQSSFEKKTPTGSKSVIRTRAAKTGKAQTGNTMTTKTGVTPGGRAYESTRQSGKGANGVPMKTSTLTNVATASKKLRPSKESGIPAGKGVYQKTRGQYGTVKLKTAQTTGSAKIVKKGPTKPR